MVFQFMAVCQLMVNILSKKNYDVIVFENVGTYLRGVIALNTTINV
jgi:hypothetical protein